MIFYGLEGINQPFVPYEAAEVRNASMLIFLAHNELVLPG